MQIVTVYSADLTHYKCMLLRFNLLLYGNTLKSKGYSTILSLYENTQFSPINKLQISQYLIHWRFVFQNLVIRHVVVTPILTIISSNKIQILSDERCNNGKTCYDNSNIAHNKKDVLTYIICIIPTNKQKSSCRLNVSLHHLIYVYVKWKYWIDLICL